MREQNLKTTGECQYTVLTIPKRDNGWEVHSGTAGVSRYESIVDRHYPAGASGASDGEKFILLTTKERLHLNTPDPPRGTVALETANREHALACSKELDLAVGLPGVVQLMRWPIVVRAPVLNMNEPRPTDAP